MSKNNKIFRMIWPRYMAFVLFASFLLGASSVASGACSVPYFEKAYLNEYYFGTDTNYIEMYVPNNTKVTSADWASWYVKVYTAAGVSLTYPLSAAQACEFGSKTYVTYNIPSGLPGTGGAVNAILYDGSGNEIDYLKFDNKSPIATFEAPQCTYPPTHDIDLLVSNYGNKDVARFPDGKGTWSISSLTGANTTFTRCASNDASITKTVSAASIPVGASAFFTVQVYNPANSALNNVTVTDLLPAGLVYESHVATVGAYTPATGLWTVGSLAKNATATLTIRFHGTAIGEYTNTATLSYTGITYTAEDSAIANIFTSLDHIRIEHDGEGLTCTPEPVTVRACANASCTSEYTGSVTTTLSPAGWVGGNTITFSGGHVIAQLSKPTAGTVTLGASSTTPVPTAATRCFSGATETCSMNFVNTGFIFSTTAVSPFNQVIPTQTAGTSSGNLYLVAVRTDTTTKACEAALQGANSVNLAYECLNPASCYGANLMSVNGSSGATTIARNNSGSVSSYTAVNMTFDANGAAPFAMVYSDVGELRLHASKVVNGATLTGSGGGVGGNGGFVVKPAGFVLSAIEQTASPNLANPAAADAGGPKFVKAGEAFSVTVTAVTSTGSTAYSYGRESTAEGVKLTSALKTGLGLTHNPTLNNNAAFGTFTNGVATGTTFSWDEVGIITLTPSVADSNYLGAGDATGTTTGDVGRFYAAKFALSAGAITNRADLCPSPPAVQPAGCPATFSYVGEPMNALFTLTAQAVGGATLQNYSYSATAANNFAKLNPMAAVTAGTGGPLGMGAVNSGATRTPFPPCGVVPAHPCLTPGQATAGIFTTGVADIVVPFSFYRGNTPVGPFPTMEIGIAPQDSDGVILSAYDLDTVNLVAGINNHAKVGNTTDIRFGRLWMGNAYGTEKRDLTLPFEMQYWNGQAFVKNTSDNRTSLTTANIALGNYQGAVNATNLPAAAISLGAFSSGSGSITLAAPNATGSADVLINLGSTGSPASCSGLTGGASASSTYLSGKWCGSEYNRNPVARATFGIFGSSLKKGPIYLRENY